MTDLSTDTSLERLPPQSIEAEQAILGSLLINTETLTKVVDTLQPEHFYRKSHQVIYAAILDLFEKSEPIDIVTLSQYLKDQGKLDNIGGRQYLTDLALSIATTANAEYYAKTVSEKSLLRNLIKAGTEIVSSCYEDGENADLVVDKAEQLIFSIAQRRSMAQLVHIKDIVNDSFARIEQRYENRDTLSGISTGFYDLDEMTSGWQKSDLVIIAARPSMGKCLAHDAEIVLADGSIQTIEAIYKAGQASLLTLNDQHRLGWTSPSAFIDDGIKPVFRVTTRLGRVVETTITHPFLTTNGWKQLGELAPGTKIAVPGRLPIEGKQSMPDSHLKLLAYLLASKNLDKKRCLIATSSEQIRQDLLQSATVFGTDLHAQVQDASISLNNNGNSLSQWLDPLYQAEPAAERNYLPAAIFTLKHENIALLLNRIFAIAGSINRYHGRQHLNIADITERLAKQIQHLLLRFGIISRIKQQRHQQNNKTAAASWQLQICQQLAIEQFHKTIGICNPHSMGADLTASDSAGTSLLELPVNRCLPMAVPQTNYPGAIYSSSPNSRPADGAGATMHELPLQLHEYSGNRSVDNCDMENNSDIYWDKIVSINHIGNKQVYDLTIPETHNFVANDICVHNTALVLNLAQHCAVESKQPVAVFSLEMSKEQLVQRLLCAEAKIDANKLRTGYLQSGDWQNLATAMGRLGEAPIFIDDSAAVSALDIRAKARRLKAEYKGLGLIIIDYIQLMQGRAKSDGNRVQEISEISRNLKQLARELNVPVLALSQLSRAVEARQNKRPMLSDLRESGAIEQDADIVMFIYRDEYYNPESEKRGEAEIIIAKQRNGPVGTVELLYQASITRFLNKAIQNSYAGNDGP